MNRDFSSCAIALCDNDFMATIKPLMWHLLDATANDLIPNREAMRKAIVGGVRWHYTALQCGYLREATEVDIAWLEQRIAKRILFDDEADDHFSAHMSMSCGCVIIYPDSGMVWEY